MRMRRFSVLPLAAALLALASPGVQAFEFHGYLRSGAGSNSKDGQQQCFQLPGAYSKYRLGNECETYAELAVDHDLYDGKDGVKFVYHGRLAYVSNNQQDYESFKADGRDIALRENWFEVKNLKFLNDGTLWAGKRFYQRNDVHITDFYYWDASGYGFGVENVTTGPVKSSFAILRNSSDQTDAVTRFDLRVGGIGLGAFGDLTVGLQYNLDDSSKPNTTDGTAITVQHFIGGVLGGFNKFAVQYGRGSAANLSFAYPNNFAKSGDESWRIVEMLQWQVSPAFSGMATLVYQDQIDNYKWFSAGLRPVWHLNDYFKIQFEYGYDQVKPSSGDDNNRRTRDLHKFTVAPTIVAGGGFWARPELRLFATYAKWNDAARDLWGGVAGGTGGLFGPDTDAWTYGFQVEAWW